jgi:uncharacterized heparinase superfamily protein
LHAFRSSCACRQGLWPLARWALGGIKAVIRKAGFGMSDLVRLFHTVRHLKAMQVFARLRNRLPRLPVSNGPPPPLRQYSGVWQPPIPRRPSMLGPKRFRFLNDERELEFPGGWNDQRLEKLWLYNLHYFDDLVAADAQSRADWHQGLISRWISENPAAHGAGWEPYPTSLRIVNWIKWAIAGWSAGETRLSDSALQSLAVQTRWLRQRLEYHLLGNHLLANAKALVFAGAFFGGREGDRWLKQGLAILEDQREEQVLPDGGHFELSPMYHALVLEDFLDLRNLAQFYGEDYQPLDQLTYARWTHAIEKMRTWLLDLTHPDGEIAFFNDAAFGIAPSSHQLQEYARRLGLEDVSGPNGGLSIHGESGYVRWQKPDCVVLLDIAAVGPDYLPGHAHADTLSYELSLFGQRVFVNSGTSCYGLTDERLRQRGTAAHNTVVVNGRNSSDVWSGFRVGGRAHARLVYTERPSDDECRLVAVHDGYSRAFGRLLHQRSWRFSRGAIEISDVLTGKYKTAEARLHLHPRIHLGISHTSEAGHQAIELRIGDHRAMLSVEGAQLSVEPSTWHPGFGVTVPNRVLILRPNKPRFVHRLQWEAR